MARIRGTLHSGGTYKAYRESEIEAKRRGQKRTYDKDEANVCLNCERKECSGRCKKFMR